MRLDIEGLLRRYRAITAPIADSVIWATHGYKYRHTPDGTSATALNGISLRPAGSPPRTQRSDGLLNEMVVPPEPEHWLEAGLTIGWRNARRHGRCWAGMHRLATSHSIDRGRLQGGRL
jgi:hypothetical protein